MGRRNFALLLVCSCFAFGLVVGAAAAEPGDLDSGFGTGGSTTLQLGTSTAATAMAVAPDGKIVVVAPLSAGGGFSVLRYLVNGTLDSSFGSGGIVTETGGVVFSGAGLAVQSDGRILVAGST